MFCLCELGAYMMNKDLFSMEGKVLLITGASSGIGESLAELFARKKSSLVLLARRQERILSLAETLEKTYGIKCLPIPCDVSNEQQAVEAVQKAVHTFGRIDVLINNAGITAKSEDITSHSTEQWESVLSTNLDGAFYISREAVKTMKEKRYGKIINISSVCGLMGLANQVSYAASKSGLIGLTRAMAVELGKYNITVNAIAPGYILTELTNEGSGGFRYFKSRTVSERVGTAEDLHGTALLLASEASSYISGAVIPVDGGITANI